MRGQLFAPHWDVKVLVWRILFFGSGRESPHSQRSAEHARRRAGRSRGVRSRAIGVRLGCLFRQAVARAEFVKNVWEAQHWGILDH